MFTYEVMPEDEAMRERFSLLPDGEYNGVITKVEAKISQNSGNNMLEVYIDIYDKNGKPQTVKDFWIFSPKTMWKVIHGCQSAGVYEKYKEGKLCPEVLEGKNVRVYIKTEVGGLIPPEKLNGKPLGTKYSDKNAVSDYLEKMIAQKEAENKPFDDDDIDALFR